MRELPPDFLLAASPGCWHSGFFERFDRGLICFVTNLERKDIWQ